MGRMLQCKKTYDTHIEFAGEMSSSERLDKATRCAEKTYCRCLGNIAGDLRILKKNGTAPETADQLIDILEDLAKECDPLEIKKTILQWNAAPIAGALVDLGGAIASAQPAPSPSGTAGAAGTIIREGVNQAINKGASDAADPEKGKSEEGKKEPESGSRYQHDKESDRFRYHTH